MADNEHAERIAVLETKVENMQETLQAIKASLEELRPILWRAAGAASAAVIIIQIILKSVH